MTERSVALLDHSPVSQVTTYQILLTQRKYHLTSVPQKISMSINSNTFDKHEGHEGYVKEQSTDLSFD